MLYAKTHDSVAVFFYIFAEREKVYKSSLLFQFNDRIKLFLFSIHCRLSDEEFNILNPFIYNLTANDQFQWNMINQFSWNLNMKQKKKLYVIF